MTGVRTRFRLAARLARREARRHPGRHVLVVVLIFVPTLAAFATFSALSTWQSIDRTRNELATAGAAAVVTEPSPELPDEPRPFTPADEARLPPGSHVEHRWTSADWLVTSRQRADGRGPVLVGTRVLELPSTSRLAGTFPVTRGRGPQGAGEVLLSAPLARAGGWNVGDTVTSARTGASLRVVGIGVRGEQVDERAMAVAPTLAGAWAAPLGGIGTVEIKPDRQVGGELRRQVYVWLPAGVDARSAIPQGRSWWWTHTPAVDARSGSLAAVASAAVAALVAVVASAAFAMASRRQLRTVGLLATTGADPAVIRTALVLQGAIPGLIAGLLAVATGVLASSVAQRRGLAEDLSHVHGAHLALSWTGAAVAITIGTGAGALAAWHPSRVAARLPVLSALAGRRPVGSVDPKVPLGGAALWMGGAVALILGLRARGIQHAGEGLGLAAAVQPFVIVLAVLALALGGVGLAPAAIALLGRGADRVRGMTRLALRGLARNRSQSAATVAAVSMALALPVGILTVRAGEAKDNRAIREQVMRNVREPARSSGPAIHRIDRAGTVVEVYGALRSAHAGAVIEQVRAILGPDALVVRTLPIVDQTGAWRRVAIIDDAKAAQVLEPWAAAALRSGAAVPLNTSRRTTGTITLTVAKDHATFPIATAPTDRLSQVEWAGPSYLVGKRAMGRVGRERPADAITVVRRARASTSEAVALRRLSGQLRPDEMQGPNPTLSDVERAVGRAPREGSVTTGDEESQVTIGWHRTADQQAPRPVLPRTGGPTLSHDDKVLLALAAATGLVAVLILTVTLSLRSVDGAADRAALVAAGATPAQVVRQRAVEGAILALVGAGLALPLGWITVMALRFGEVRHVSNGNAITDRLVAPGWQALPILVAPALLVAVLWWLVPTARSALGRHQRDLLAPRW